MFFWELQKNEYDKNAEFQKGQKMNFLGVTNIRLKQKVPSQ